LRSPRFFVEVSGVTRAVEYFVDIGNLQDPARQPVSLIIPSFADLTTGGKGPAEQRKLIAPPVDPMAPYRRFAPNFRGRQGTYGQQLRGGPPGQAPAAVLAFSSNGNDGGERAEIVPNNGRVPFELRVGVERSGDEMDEAATRLE